jgi:hypothetical protein
MEVAHNFTDKQERSHPGASTMMYTVAWTQEWHCTWMHSEGEGMSKGSTKVLSCKVSVAGFGQNEGRTAT